MINRNLEDAAIELLHLYDLGDNLSREYRIHDLTARLSYELGQVQKSTQLDSRWYNEDRFKVVLIALYKLVIENG